MQQRKKAAGIILSFLCLALCACQTPQEDTGTTPGSTENVVQESAPTYAVELTVAPTEAVEITVIPTNEPTATPTPTVEEILAAVPDLEIGRAFNLGLVPEEMMCEYDSVVTERELVDLIANAVEKMDASKVAEWQEISSAATNAKTIRQEAAIALYIAACLFDEIPMANVDCDERVDWSRWIEDGVYADWSVGVSLSNIFQKYGYETGLSHL